MKKITILLFLAHSILFAQNTIPNQNDFSYEALDYYQQNNPNFHMTEISTWLWNWDVWVVEAKSFYEYNDKNQLVRTLDQKWNNDQWEDWSKMTNIYNEHDLILITLFQRYSIDVWENTSRYVFTYDEIGNKIEDVYYTWDEVEGDWENNIKNIYGYDELNRTIYQQSLIWENNEWKNVFQQLITYNEQNNVVENIFHSWDGVAWINNFITTFSYDAKDRPSERFVQNWIGGQWVFASKGNYLYGINDSLSTYTSYTWNGTNWEYNRRDVYEWADDNLTNLLSQTWEQNGWVNSSDKSYVYDSFKNKLEDVKRYWENSDWENFYRWQYSWGRITDVDKENQLEISDYKLQQNYPNPFNPSTTLKYSLPEQSTVKIEIFNPLGQIVNLLIEDTQVAGHHEITWDATSFPSGIYLSRLSAISLKSRKEFHSTKKMVLLK